MTKKIALFVFVQLFLISVSVPQELNSKKKVTECISMRYVLRKEHIIRLSNLLTAQVQKIDTNAIIYYTIIYENGDFITTESINDVLDNDNKNENKITSIQFLCKSSLSNDYSDSSYILARYTDKFIEYEIQGDNTEWSLNTQYELMDIINSTVDNSIIFMKHIYIIIMLPFLMLIISIPFALYFRYIYDKNIHRVNQQHKKTPLLIYLFTINDKTNFRAIDITYYIISMIILSLSIKYISTFLTNSLFPWNVFYIGQQISTYETISKIREIILLVLSFVLTLIIILYNSINKQYNKYINNNV